MDQLITEDPTSIGPYRLIARLGAGGMGLVYLGRSEAGRTVAVKVVQAEHAQHPEFRKRFALEVAAARRVGGVWTAAVLDADTQASTPWVATQYIPGPDLHTVVTKDFGPLPEHSLRTLANRLALALQAVNEAGLIHRDLKPSNVLVTVDGPRVIDFGIARAMDGLAGDSLHTHTGILLGSPGFMSPEQVRGLELSGASDVFCLGAVLVFAATGRLLFGATSTGLNAHLFRVAEEEADLTGVPESLVDLVRECLHKDPARRPTPQQIATRTVTDAAEEWLPGAVLAQLGRHAAQLLDYAPAAAVGAPAAPAAPGAPAAPQDPRVASALPGPMPPPPGYPPTAPGHFGPAQGYGPPLGPPPGAWSAPPYAAYVPAQAQARLQDSPPPHPRRWWGLLVIALTQLMVLLNTAGFSLALPSVRADLAVSNDGVSLVLSSYLLTFGGLLLLGGHIADLAGRKRTLIIGLVGFAVASALGGAADSTLVLIVARGLQGVFAALLTPSALSLVGTGFTDPKERGRAFGIYAAIAAGGSALGLFTGGWLIEMLSWRWCLFINVPLAAIAVVGAATLLHDRPGRGGAHLDMLGLLLGSVGLVAVVYGLDGVESHGWADLRVWGPCAPGVVLLLVFVLWQTRSANPLLPPAVFRDRNRLGCVLAMLLAGVGIVTLLPTLTFYLQRSLGYSAAATGVACLPMVAAIVIGSTQVSARLLRRTAPRVLIVTGLVIAALGLLLLTGLQADSAYTTQVLPGMLLAGFGTGLAYLPIFAIATAGVAPQVSGATSATVATAQQVGAVIGGALLSGILGSQVRQLLAALSNGAAVQRMITAGMLQGYTTALWWAVGAMLLASLTAAAMVTAKAPDPH